MPRLRGFPRGMLLSHEPHTQTPRLSFFRYQADDANGSIAGRLGAADQSFIAVLQTSLSSSPAAHATAPAPPTGPAAAAATRIHDDHLHLLDETVDFLGEILFQSEGYRLDRARYQGEGHGANGRTTQNGPYCATAINRLHWFSPV
jgi:hypothetical protein